MRKNALFLMALWFVATLSAPVPAASSGEEVIRRSQAAFYAAGEDIKARVRMRLIHPAGKVRERELTMLRRNRGGGEQRYFLYFHSPGDVRGTAFMVWKYPGRDDDRWLFVPALNLVRRIAARDSQSSFVGSDFTYEDISGRDLEADTHTLVREEEIEGRRASLVESRPKSPAAYTRKLAWVDQATFLSLKEEYYDLQGSLYKVFTADEIREVQRIPTVVRRTMTNIKSGHKTEVVFERVEYNLGIEEDLFTERFLKRPPERWIK